ncbi:surface carbohydrate biosynthesis protein [Azospirillum halopraeferens]|uniref:surface carbohydrate biosynthesis protein n=1 Tax=Azospirillum halopraeferens TaxID=34010 RepID=UPI0004181CDB|nr:surface carbohydrate biosynthesis protein [Azospirillum halopraeferens]
MTSAKPTLYLPIEVAARELDARLLLAHRALGAGYRVVIGQQWLLIANLANVVPGVVFFKGMNRIQKNWMVHAKRHGHTIAAIDEEVTAIAAPDFIVKEVTEDAIRLIDAIFMQGPLQSRVYGERFPAHTERFKITGNPRWDLLRPEFSGFFTGEAARIRATHGDFILLNTNLGFVNSSWGSPQKYINVCINVGYIDPKNPADLEWLKDQFEFEKQSFHAFRALAVRLRDRYPGRRIVLRPHPAENLDTWRKALANQSDVLVLAEGSAIPWIVASGALIHNTCTTGIEGTLLSKPTIAYAPFTNWCESIFISNQVTPRFADFDALGGALDQALADPESFVAESRSRHAGSLNDHFAAVDSTLATDAIFDEVTALTEHLSHGRTDSLLRPGRSLTTDAQRNEYQVQKISITDAALTARFHEIAGALGRPVSVSTRSLGDSLVMMEAD